MSLSTIREISNRYGSNPLYVLAGGGNTSYKNGDRIYVKASGTSLANMTEDDFVLLDRCALASIWEKTYPSDTVEREAEVLKDLLASRVDPYCTKRPSVESLLHDLFPHTYILHVHPCHVNAVTCSNDGEKAVREMFGNRAVWVTECEPGYKLADKCRKALMEYEKENGKPADILFLQNHGIFFAANTEEELDSLFSDVMKKIDDRIEIKPDFTECTTGYAEAAKIAPAIRMAYSPEGHAFVKFTSNLEVLKYADSENDFDILRSPISPDHIVYCKAEPLFISDFSVEGIKKAFSDFENRCGFKPKIVFAKGVGMFSIGKTYKEALTARDVWTDCMTVTTLAGNFGGVRHMAPEMADFIVHWEAESYRQKMSIAQGSSDKLAGKIIIVTGSAQGFGAGIAEYLADEGAALVIADMNEPGAIATAKDIGEKYSVPTLAVKVNVSDEDSVKEMIEKTVCEFGGLDVLVNNAGIVRAGSLEEMTKANFELVTAVNYTAYFLCTKYSSAVMKIQRAASPEYIADIVEINSKSGLSGSNKNFAYAGSKFGGIGLTQSFALELAPYGIKVNAVCPGNFLDGPLWSDPVKGLFVQYLNAGKVPGAKTVEDVRRYYEAKVPLGRGCRTDDVAKAVSYIIDQKYETGQALPVTGGQEMLK